MTDSAQSVSVRIGYTNHRGEFAVRVITPVSVWYGETVWHPEPQWFLKALDVEKQAERDFAFSGFGKSVMTDIPDKAVEAALEAYLQHPGLWGAMQAALAAASPFMGALGVREFANAILHGDDEHRAWLLEAAEAFIAGTSLPEPRDKGSAPVPQDAPAEPETFMGCRVVSDPTIAPHAVELRDRDGNVLARFDFGAPVPAAAPVPPEAPAGPVAWTSTWQLEKVAGGSIGRISPKSADWLEAVPLYARPVPTSEPAPPARHDALREAREALKPFAKFAGDLTVPKNRFFLQLLVCPKGDAHPEDYGQHFQRAKAAVAKIDAVLAAVPATEAREGE